MPHVLVAGRIHDAGLDLLRRADGVTLDLVDEVSTASYASKIAEADALLLRTQPLPAEVIARAGRLRIVSRHGVGYDAVDVAALDARGIPLAIVGDVNSRTVAEHVLGLMLALAKRIPVRDHGTRNGHWDLRNDFVTTELDGKTLLLVGFGRIGQRVAALATAFGMTVLAFDPFHDGAAIRAAGAEPMQSLHTGLQLADWVSLHASGTPTTLIGANELRQMKVGAFLINTARGGLVDEAALVEALDAGRLAGAATDVFANEPPRFDDPILASGLTILSPHAAGLTAECAARMSRRAAQNILDCFAGTLDPALVVNAWPTSAA